MNKGLKLLVSTCYHKLCEICVERLFSQGPSSCPTCKNTLRRANFSLPTFDDLAVEKEVRIRKHVSSYLDKQEEDFPTLEAFNLYLEEFEEIVHNLANDISVSKTLELLDRLKEENKEVVQKNRAKAQSQIQKELAQAQLIQQERTQRREKDFLELRKEESRRKRCKIDLINELANSDDPAIVVLAKKNASLRISSKREQALPPAYFPPPEAEPTAKAEELAPFDALAGIKVWSNIWNIHLASSEIEEWCKQPQSRAAGISVGNYLNFMVVCAFSSFN